MNINENLKILNDDSLAELTPMGALTAKVITSYNSVKIIGTIPDQELAFELSIKKDDFPPKVANCRSSLSDMESPF